MADEEVGCFALHVPDGCNLRRVYHGGDHHTFQISQDVRFWGDQFVPSIVMQAARQVVAIWYDIKTADGGPLLPTQILFAPHVSGLNAFIFPISFFTAPAAGPLTIVSLVPIAPPRHCSVSEMSIPRWAVNAQRPPGQLATGLVPPPATRTTGCLPFVG